MSSFNLTVLLGNLTRDPEMKTLPSGATVCEFDIAVNRNWTGKDGQKQKETLFMKCSAWAKTGELCAKFLQKGKLVLVQGHLKQRSWNTDDGSKRTAIELVADSVQFMPSSAKPVADPPADAPDETRIDTEGIPF